MAMPKAAPPNAEPVDDRATRYPRDHGPAEVRDWNWVDSTPRRLVGASLALVLGGLVLWGIEKEVAQIEFQLLVSTLRTTPGASLIAALAASALSYLALFGYDVCALRYARAHA